ncbi:conserved hypothetical protein [Nostocoides australiense Ben110]|uniref:N-acetyltransferase domain-containing protein n=1 Tax=Nostocoides australiense Ben110 TaxID=1193182 RepID=W6JUV3_9MICO|nr:GNAT family N-acetyltransferase [Tetrasphaera australiensis]CCH72300.1 conserved hypothetical protein [Tetrasphaera australiensis Ben110]
MSEVPGNGLDVRPARPEDLPAIVELLRTALGKKHDQHYEAYLDWKHQQSPFGASPAWVAADGERVVGFRTFMRWSFLGADGRRLRAVRAVDTATDAGYRGQGIFRRLTLQAVADLTMAGDGFVFNTPNDQSRPGYRSMGWQPAGRLPVGVLPGRPGSLPRIAAARGAAEIWSTPTDVGVPAREVFAQAATAAVLLRRTAAGGTRTERTPEYLRWRYGFEPLHYRVAFAEEGDPASGGLVFRLRRRGGALEAVVADVFAGPRSGFATIRRVLAVTGADYAISLRSGPASGFVPVPRQGPLLVTRPLATGSPEPRSWRLTMGDIELF